MGFLKIDDVGGYLCFDAADCRAKGGSLSATYQSAEPFPSIMIDDFLDSSVLEQVLDGFPDRDDKRFFDRDQERYKYQFSPWETQSGAVRNLLAELNSHAFLGFLEAMTGIKGLLPDPYFSGGGLHETRKGGHLSVHADFNIHGELNVERRLNLLIYLNKDWPAAYGGALELWDREMTRKVKTIDPLFGRAVVFSTDMSSFHGHPEPLTCPPERSRRSIATYYYVAPKNGVASIPRRTTLFKPRPETGDRRDLAVGFEHWVNDWVPHRLQRFVRRFGPQ